MSNEIDDGGPAFPMPAGPEPAGFTHYNEGMSLRDHFAGQAMQGMLADGGYEQLAREVRDGLADDEMGMVDVVSQVSYIIADAMIKARKESK